MSYPAPTTGLGVAAKILVAGNSSPIPSKSKLPGYNNVVLSLSGANGPTTFQLQPDITDVAGNAFVAGTPYTLTQIAPASGPDVLALTAVATATGVQAVYTGTITGGGSNAWVGYSFIVTGFANAANNGTFVCLASTTTTLTLENPFAVAQTGTASAAGVEGTATLTGTIVEAANSLAGKSVVVTGFVNAVNNGVFIITANNGTTTITVANPDALAETHSATATVQEAQWVDAVSAVASSTGVYTGTFPEYASFPIGGQVTIAGFVTNAVNNGTFTIISATSTTLTTSNTASIAETHAATATVSPYQTITYFYSGERNFNPQFPTSMPVGTPVVVATVSATGLITAVSEGACVVEASFPVFANNAGTTGAKAPNPMFGLPSNKIYAEVNVTVVS